MFLLILYLPKFDKRQYVKLNAQIKMNNAENYIYIEASIKRDKVVLFKVNSHSRDE
jgi:hypothetical protein